tara:strand:- start:822 stop:1100 length:279 start_codon:yes stop_codon:yes gene_type:complete
MNDFNNNWNKLPIELRSKIMYSGWITHPVADIIKEFIKETSYLNLCRYNLYKLMYDPLEFVDYLKETMYLKETKIDIHDLLVQIIMLHTQDL